MNGRWPTFTPESRDGGELVWTQTRSITGSPHTPYAGPRPRPAACHSDGVSPPDLVTELQRPLAHPYRIAYSSHASEDQQGQMGARHPPTSAGTPPAAPPRSRLAGLQQPRIHG